MNLTWRMRWGGVVGCLLLFLGMMPLAQAQKAETTYLDAFIAQAQGGQLITMDFKAKSEDDFTGQSTEVEGRVALGMGFSRFETDDRVIVMVGDTSWVMDRSQNRVIISVLAPEEREFSVEWFLMGSQMDSQVKSQVKSHRDNGSKNDSSTTKEPSMGFDDDIYEGDVFEGDLPWQLEQVTRETIDGEVLEKVTIASTDPFSTWESAQLWMAMRGESAEGGAQSTPSVQSKGKAQAAGQARGVPVKMVVNDPVGATTTTQFTSQRWVNMDATSIQNPLMPAQETGLPWVLPVDQNTQITDLRESAQNQEGPL